MVPLAGSFWCMCVCLRKPEILSLTHIFTTSKGDLEGVCLLLFYAIVRSSSSSWVKPLFIVILFIKASPFTFHTRHTHIATAKHYCVAVPGVKKGVRKHKIY